MDENVFILLGCNNIFEIVFLSLQNASLSIKSKAFLNCPLLATLDYSHDLLSQNMQYCSLLFS